MKKKILICIIFLMMTVSFSTNLINYADALNVESEILDDNPAETDILKNLDKELILKMNYDIENRYITNGITNIGGYSALAEIVYVGDNKLFAGGYLEDNALYCKIDSSSGKIIWKKTWSSSEGDAQIWGVTKEGYGIVYACGTIYTSDEEYALGFILKIDFNNGDVLNSKIIYESDSYYSLRDIQYYNSGLYIVGTYDRGEGSSFYPSALRLKYNTNLEKEWGYYHTYFDSLAWGQEVVIANGWGYSGGTCLTGVDHPDLQALITEFDINTGVLADYSKDYGFTWYTEDGWGLTYSKNNDRLYIVSDEQSDFDWYAKIMKVKRIYGDYESFNRYPFAGMGEECKGFDVIWNDYDNMLYMTGYSKDYIGGDAILLKIGENVEGSFTCWHWGKSGADCGWGINVDYSGNIYIVGATTSYSSGMDAFVLKYSTSGSLKWETVLLADDNSPPDAPYISGPTNGYSDASYTYNFKSYDPENNDVKYFIDWGDGNSDWTSWQSSGSEFSMSHTFSWGSYTIRAKAKDTEDAQSDWNYLAVIMPRNRVIEKPFFNFLQQYPHLFAVMHRLLQSLK